MRLLLIIFSIILFSSFAYADQAVLKLTQPWQYQNLHHVGKAYEASSSTRFPQSWDELSAWESIHEPLKKRALFSGRYFLVTKVRNETPLNEFVLYPYNTVLSKIESRIYTPETVLRVFSGGKVENEFAFHYGNQVTLEPNQDYYIVTLFESDFFYTPVKLTIEPLRDFQQEVVYENLIMTLCFGVGIVLGLYNLLIYIGSKDITHFYYALFTCVWVFAWSHFFHIPDELFGFYSANLHWLGFALAPLTNALFYIHLLKLKDVHPNYVSISIWLGVIAALGLPFCILFPGFGFIWATLVTGLALCFGLFVGIKRWVEGFKPARYFVMAYIAMAIPNMVGNLTNLSLLPESSSNLYLYGLIGTALDALLLAFAVADKFRITSEENIELNKNLEAKVLKRTYELEQVASELRDASEAKSRFLANMSHEIRTPMTSIIGYADGIMLGDIKPHERNHAISVILQNSRHVLGLINDILDMSKIEANKLEVELVESNLFQAIAHVDSLLGKQIRDKGLEFALNYHFPLPDFVVIDPTRLRQILLNLTSNAMKFTTVGKISIDVACQNERLMITVRDTGIGMTADEQKELFSAFYQADSSTSRKYGGTGLGLNISKSLARKLDGDISVESEVGSGTAFTLTVGLYTTEKTKWVQSLVQIGDVREQGTIPDEITQELKGEVLLAEDNTDNSKLIKRILERMGLSVTAVENGQLAVQAVLDGDFDLILMDIQMPVMDGEQAFSFIQATGCSTPVIALTANTMQHEIERYLKLGFSDHLAKPIDRVVFSQKVAYYLDIQVDEEVDLPEAEFYQLKQQYISGLHEQIIQIKNQAKYQDYDALAKTVHAIKGTAAMFDCIDIHKIANELDAKLKNKQLECVEVQLTELLGAMTAAIESEKQQTKQA
ncbi:response regulator [Pseudoalteromonas sp. CO348]|uniref:ATP-binding protein n=1 Tax=Pseudoalteromonas sp. CO348 TaxID=1777271 RepID=UPI001023A0F7|nr:ATP-binding protein [Pseudoalteromonas sp. CO348]RZG07265.1 response regulator [Pseudoalteromonas sp. CO348]